MANGKLKLVGRKNIQGHDTDIEVDIGAGKDADITYTVTLKKLPAGKTLYALYNNVPNDLKVDDAGNGNIKFTLNVGDPPVGMG